MLVQRMVRQTQYTNHIHQEQTQNLDDKPPSSSSLKNEYSCIDNYNNKLTYPAIPSFIIAGAQKSGTTALYHIFAKHPLLVTTPEAEARFFTKRRNQIQITTTQGEICSKGYEYYQLFNVTSKQDRMLRSGSIHAYEKSPLYILDPKIPEMILKVCPWKPKIIIILRNPIDRAYSQYLMVQKRNQYFSSSAINEEDITFEEKMIQDFEELKKAGILTGTLDAPEIGTWNHTSSYRKLRDNILFKGFYSEQLKSWLRHFKLDHEMMVIQYETFEKNHLSVFRKLIKFIGLPPIDITEDDLSKDMGPIIPNTNQSLTNADRAQMKSETRDLLKRLYKPYNNALVDLLGNEWKDVWVN